jgi:hypothetical protein
MKRLLLALALLAGVTLASTKIVDAQVKKDPKKDAAVGAIEIYKTKAGMRYRIVDAEGRTIAMPPPAKHWDTREDVVKALDELKQTLNKAKPMDVKE